MFYSGCLIVSMLSGMWALVIFRRSAADFISQFHITAKFFNFQVFPVFLLKYKLLVNFCLSLFNHACSLLLFLHQKVKFCSCSFAYIRHKIFNGCSKQNSEYVTVIIGFIEAFGFYIYLQHKFNSIHSPLFTDGFADCQSSAFYHQAVLYSLCPSLHGPCSPNRRQLSDHGNIAQGILKLL